MSAKIITRACLLAIAALTLSALLLQPRAAILSADALDWHATPAHRLTPQSLSNASAIAAPPHAPNPAPASLSKPMQSSPQSYSPTVYLPQPIRIEWLILLSDTIARVKLIQVESHTTTNNETPNYHARHGAELWFEFEVLEYLKGDGKAKIWGVTIAPFHRVATEQEAEAVANYLLNTRDTRWDNAEAIIFLYNEIQSIPSASHPDRYALGSLLEGNPPQAAYSLDSVGGWFPLLPSKRAPGPRGARRFLLIDPDFQEASRFTEDIGHTRNTWRELGASESSDTTTMAVSDLKRLIANEPALVRLEQEREIAIIRDVTRPEKLTATQTNNGIMLRWELWTSSPYYDTTGYRVFRRADGETEFTRISDVRTLNKNYEDTTAVEPGVAYTYKVAAILKDDIPSLFNTSYGEYGGEAEVSITTAGVPEPTPTHTPNLTATPWAPRASHGAHLPNPFSIEEWILRSDTIARVKLLEVNDYIDTDETISAIEWRYGAELWFEFEVVEYLKGSGNSKIWGVANAPYYRVATKEEAKAVAKYLQDTRDTRWDDREAIIFLRNENISVSSTSHPDRYALSIFIPGEATHSLKSVGGWFPMSSSNDASGASDDQRLMLIDPDSNAPSHIAEDTKRARNTWRELGASESSDMTTMAVSDLRRLIANESELLRREQERQIATMRNRTAPQELTATQTSAGIALRWTFVEAELYFTTSYRISRKASGEAEFTKISDVQPQWNVTYEDITATEPGVAYTYKVTAILKDDIPSRFNTSYGEYGGEAEVSITTATVHRTATPTPTPTLTPSPADSLAVQ